MVIVRRRGFGCLGRGCGGFGALRAPTADEIASVRRMFVEADFRAFVCGDLPPGVDWGPLLDAEAKRRGTSLWVEYQRCDPTLSLADAKAKADRLMTAAARALEADAETEENTDADADAQDEAEAEEERRRLAALLAAKPAGLPGWVVPVGVLALAGIGLAALAMRRSA